MKLTDTLNSLLSAALRNEGTPMAAALPRGLAISITLTRPANVAIVTLQLRRANIPPSDSEARIVLAHWPGGPQKNRNFTAYNLDRDGVTYHYLQTNWRQLAPTAARTSPYQYTRGHTMMPLDPRFLDLDFIRTALIAVAFLIFLGACLIAFVASQP